MNQRDSIKMTPEQALAYLASRHSCALATNGHDGYPHVVAMWYTVKDGAIMMTSYARAQKIVNLRRDPRATVLVESGATYKELAGVMVRGRVELIDGPAALADYSEAHRRRPEQSGGGAPCAKAGRDAVSAGALGQLGPLQNCG